MSVHCRGCKSSSLDLFLDLGNMPLAGAFLSGPDKFATEQTYPLPVHVCAECGLVQIVKPIDPEILFQDYSFSSSTVPALVTHFENYAHWIHSRYKPESLVEFGANDGILIAPLKKLGVKATGVDISANITAMARDKGLDIATGYFDSQMAEELRKRLGPVDLITGSNAFAHNEKPQLILEAARKLLKPDGRLCLEVMYAGDLLELWQWDTLYHEHLTFYSLGTLRRLLESEGFFIDHAERIPMHGGSLRISATQKKQSTLTAECKALEEYEAKLALNALTTWQDWGRRVGRKLDIVKTTLGNLSAKHSIWGYGAAGKATMWVNACSMDYLGGMVDSSPLRAGKFMPGTHTPIVFPDKFKEANPDFVFVTAWNYAPGISAKENWYKGFWVTPLPELRIF